MSCGLQYFAWARALDTLGWAPLEFILADTFALRLRGMVGRRPLAASGLPNVMAFPDCTSVHTCFMTYPLDIAFIDREGRILELHQNVLPWSFRSCPGAWAVLERASIQINIGAIPSGY